MFDRIIDIIYGIPSGIDDRAHHIADGLPRTMYWLGYALGLAVQFAAGFAIGRVIKIIILFLIAIH